MRGYTKALGSNPLGCSPLPELASRANQTSYLLCPSSLANTRLRHTSDYFGQGTGRSLRAPLDIRHRPWYCPLTLIPLMGGGTLTGVCPLLLPAWAEHQVVATRVVKAVERLLHGGYPATLSDLADLEPEFLEGQHDWQLIVVIMRVLSHSRHGRMPWSFIPLRGQE